MAETLLKVSCIGPYPVKYNRSHETCVRKTGWLGYSIKRRHSREEAALGCGRAQIDDVEDLSGGAAEGDGVGVGGHDVDIAIHNNALVSTTTNLRYNSSNEAPLSLAHIRVLVAAFVHAKASLHCRTPRMAAQR